MGLNGDGELAVDAQLKSSYAVAVPTDRSFFSDDTNSLRIRLVAPDGRTSTVAERVLPALDRGA